MVYLLPLEGKLIRHTIAQMLKSLYLFVILLNYVAFY